MSVEALVAAIEAEASVEAERVLADAEAAAAARVADAEASADARVAAALAEAEPAILGAEVRALNAARLALAARRTARLAARVEAAFALAELRVTRISGGADPGRWAGAIERLAAETASLTGPGEVRVRACDARHLDDLRPMLEEQGIAVVADETMPPGVRGRSADGRLHVDATIRVRLARARASLLPDVAAIVREAETPEAETPEAAAGPVDAILREAETPEAEMPEAAAVGPVAVAPR